MSAPRVHTYHVRVATYNVHRCRGLDQRTMPERIGAVVAGLDADIVALQEVLGPGVTGSDGHVATIADLAGMQWVMAPTRHLRGHLYGNVVLSKHPIRDHARYELPSQRREPRCCQRVDVEIAGHPLHFFNVHLGTGLIERRRQAVHLANILDDFEEPGPLVMLGDFNEWTRGPATRVLTERLDSLDLTKHLRRRRTYPGLLPMLHLDHIYHRGSIEVASVALPRTRRTLVASDHLPLVAALRVTGLNPRAARGGN